MCDLHLAVLYNRAEQICPCLSASCVRVQTAGCLAYILLI